MPAPKLKVKVPCDNCGATLERHPYRLNYAKRQFCDRGCFAEWRSKHIKNKNHPRWISVSLVECHHCGKVFRRTSPCKHSRNDHHFCSRRCFEKHMKTHMLGDNNPNYVDPIVKPCDYCGKPVERPPSRVGTAERKYHFCDTVCKGKWQSEKLAGCNSPLWKGGRATYYGPNWTKQSQEARKRDGHKCGICGKDQREIGRRPDAHHIIPFRTFGYVEGENEKYIDANRLDNLISLCPRCHVHVEHGKIHIPT